MNILKSFEIFLREPLSLLRDRIIQIVNINTGSTQNKSVNIDLLEQKAQITVINSDKMYHLFQTVMYKQRKKMEENIIGTQKPKEVVIGRLTARK